MGGRGTDVAREAPSLVLLDDDFASIIEAVRLGRRIYDNLRKAMAYILAVHVPIAGMSATCAVRLAVIFFPVHIAFLEFIIDPACSIIFEAEREEKNTMRRPPRPTDEPLFSGWNLGLSLLQGMGVLLLAIAIFGMALHHGIAEDEARALAFTTLVVANLTLIFANRSWERTIPNRALWLISGATVLFLALVLQVPLLRELFHFAPLDYQYLLIAVGAGLLSVAWFELFKLLRKPRLHNKPQ